MPALLTRMSIGPSPSSTLRDHALHGAGDRDVGGERRGAAAARDGWHRRRMRPLRCAHDTDMDAPCEIKSTDFWRFGETVLCRVRRPLLREEVVGPQRTIKGKEATHSSLLYT